MVREYRPAEHLGDVIPYEIMEKQMTFNVALFWDVDVTCLDMVAHARFIIERVVTRGTLDDWKLLLDLYGKEKIKDVVCRFVHLILRAFTI